ncbi:hypothetical protein DIPPA_35361 [Diplonema papillatum]|nr:hypothetical protein DIPPA_35361 [Diplonema papillatum]
MGALSAVEQRLSRRDDGSVRTKPLWDRPKPLAYSVREYPPSFAVGIARRYASDDEPSPL